MSHTSPQETAIPNKSTIIQYPTHNRHNPASNSNFFLSSPATYNNRHNCHKQAFHIPTPAFPYHHLLQPSQLSQSFQFNTSQQRQHLAFLLSIPVAPVTTISIHHLSSNSNFFISPLAASHNRHNHRNPVSSYTPIHRQAPKMQNHLLITSHNCHNHHSPIPLHNPAHHASTSFPYPTSLTPQPSQSSQTPTHHHAPTISFCHLSQPSQSYSLAPIHPVSSINIIFYSVTCHDCHKHIFAKLRSERDFAKISFFPSLAKNSLSVEYLHERVIC